MFKAIYSTAIFIRWITHSREPCMDMDRNLATDISIDVDGHGQSGLKLRYQIRFTIHGCPWMVMDNMEMDFFLHRRRHSSHGLNKNSRPCKALIHSYVLCLILEHYYVIILLFGEFLFTRVSNKFIALFGFIEYTRRKISYIFFVLYTILFRNCARLFDSIIFVLKTRLLYYFIGVMKEIRVLWM